MERSGMTQSQGLGLLRFARNDCKYFCPITYYIFMQIFKSSRNYATPKSLIEYEILPSQRKITYLLPSSFFLLSSRPIPSGRFANAPSRFIYSGFRSMRYILAPSSLAGRGLGVGFLYFITPGSAVIHILPIEKE